MTLALCALSHSPLFGINDPGAATMEEVRATLDQLRSFVRDFDPELALVFGPDHFNGVFYDMMPAFCIASGAVSVGDWGTVPGPLSVDRDAARGLVRAALDAGIDVAQSEQLQVDHGITQPLEFLFGKDSPQAVVPVFINAVGLPLGPMRRVRLLGEALGHELISSGKRVLIIGSGGLSHDPPVPRLNDAPPDVVARLINGRNPSEEARAARQRRVIDAGKAHAAGDTTYRAINPEFDQLVLDTLASGELSKMDDWANDWIEEAGGHSGHEIRAWLAAFAALSTAGSYRVTTRAYWPVEEWMTGFAMVSAISE
ncbi:3-carboxyethylcatechol 2,3-dioxygenase [Paraburkholderia sp. BCC1884]|uniref:3-carboxyethylcatechol 2,3-dioxygenase n=1 Tax=Paraburkholderia sp. BCC1884 TaxID=2562668 RepID=UPI00118274C1|nr:3-carboxyethylcatechol 2,3-dioxygenase [Paraburkholderia sp. BCC1884]